MSTLFQNPRTRAIRADKPIVRTTFRWEALVGRPGQPSPKLNDVIPVILSWAQEKHHEEFPPHAWKCESFDADESNSQVLALRDGKEWAMRLRQQDVAFGDRPSVAGRVWTTEIALRQRGERLIFGCVINYSSQPGEDPAVTLTRPRVCLDLAQKFGLIDDLELIAEATHLTQSSELTHLYELLVSEHRRKPVVVIAEVEEDQLRDDEEDSIIKPDNLARKLHCLAHVIAIPSDLAQEWARLVGKEWAVFRGGVRVYLPGLNFDEQEPFQHHLAIYNAIRVWKWAGNIGPDAYRQFLSSYCIENSLRFSSSQSILKYFTELKVALTKKRVSSSNLKTSDEIGALRAQLRAMQEQLDEFVQIAEQSQDDEQKWKAEAERAKDENYRLKRLNEAWRLSVEESGRTPAEVAERPSRYEDLAGWVAAQLAGRLVLHNRAVRALKDARYQDIELVVSTLELLAGSYRDMGVGAAGAKQRFEAGCQLLGLRFDRSIRGTRAGMEGETYFVQYPPNSGQRVFLEWHLAKGNDRDQENCFRVYFFFDDLGQEVVVGWLPSHLDIRST